MKSFDEYQEAARRTQPKDNYTREDKLYHAVFGLASEACDALGVSMSTVASLNIYKLRARYPDGFDAERSLHRAADDI